MNTEKSSESPGGPEAQSRVVTMKLQVVVEADFVEHFSEDQTVGQLLREATDKAMSALNLLLNGSSSGSGICFKILDRSSAEIKVR